MCRQSLTVQHMMWHTSTQGGACVFIYWSTLFINLLLISTLPLFENESNKGQQMPLLVLQNVELCGSCVVIIMSCFWNQMPRVDLTWLDNKNVQQRMQPHTVLTFDTNHVQERVSILVDRWWNNTRKFFVPGHDNCYDNCYDKLCWSGFPQENPPADFQWYVH